MTFDLTKTTELNLTKDFILSNIKEEEIWSHYGIPITKGLFCSKIRNDKNPTCSLYRNKAGRLIMKDFGTNWSGDCFAYVSELFNSSFYETLVIIANDFNLIKTDIKKNKPKLEYSGEKIELNSTAIIQVEIRPFQQYELDWWAKFGISEKTLKKYNVFSCKNVWLNGNIFHLEKENQLVFGYYGGIKDGIELWRVYMPSRFSKRYKFISNWQSSKLQGAKLLPKDGGDYLVITKSLKDVMVLYEFGIPAIAPCSENLFVTQNTYNKLKSKFKKIFLLYDLDSAGIRASKKIKSDFPDIQVLLLPRTKRCKDCSDFVKKYGKENFKKLIDLTKRTYLPATYLEFTK